MRIPWGSDSVGTLLEDVLTPALVLDLDVLERNLAEMTDFTVTAGVSLRPHAKAHKSVWIAEKQLALGAVGLCCQTLGEAIVFAGAGLSPILITNQVIGEQKISRLTGVAARAEVGVCVDSADWLDMMDALAQSKGVVLDVLVELQGAWYRPGVSEPDRVAALAKDVSARGHLRFSGIQAYNAAAQHITQFDARVASARSFHQTLRRALDAVASVGLECEIVTGGGTGTYDIENAAGLYTDLQPGTYVFMDGGYVENLSAKDTERKDFGIALSVLTTVISRPGPEIAVVDCGTKGITTDHGMPLVRSLDGTRSDLKYVRSSDEHGVIELAGHSVQVGHRLMLVPFNVDPTVNLYDEYLGIRAGQVTEVIPVSARGQRISGIA